MNTIRGLSFIALLFAPLAAVGQQDTLRLSLDQSIELARTTNPALRATRNDESVADWDVRQAYGSLLPSASVGGGFSWQGAGEQRLGSLTLAQNQPAYYISNYDVGVTFQLDGNKLLAPAAARARRSVTAAQIRAAELSLDAAVTRAYLEILRRADGETFAWRRDSRRSGRSPRSTSGRLKSRWAAPRWASCNRPTRSTRRACDCCSKSGSRETAP